MPIFNLLDNACHIIFQSDSSNLHYFHQQISVLIVLNAHQLSDSLIFANLVCIKCYLIILVLCVSMITNEVEHLFSYLFFFFFCEVPKYLTIF